MRHYLTIFLLLLPCHIFAGPTALPPPVVPQCFGADAVLAGGDDPKLDRLEAGGFGWVATEFSWAAIEKTKGVYDFADADALLAGLAAHHLKPLFILDDVGGVYPPGPDAAPFARFVTAAVRRYRGRTILWEIAPGAPGPQTAQAIRDGDPDATVIAARFRPGLPVAAVALSPPPQAAPEDTSGVDAARRLIQSAAPSAAGFPLVSSGADNAQAAPGEQAQALIRRWLSDLAAGVRLSLCGDVTGAASAPALLAARTLTRTLNGYRFIKRVPLASPDDYLLLFTHGPDGVKVAAWTAGPDHAIRLPVGAAAALTAMSGDALPVAPSGGRLSLTLTGSPTYLDAPGDAALRQAGAWAATPQNALHAAGEPVRLAVTYHNPDGVPHRVRFVALLTTHGGARTPLPAGEDIVGPRRTLTLGMQASAPSRSAATVRVGLVLDGVRQPYPQDIGFAPLARRAARLPAVRGGPR